MKSESEIRAMLKEVERDKRLSKYEPADLQVNYLLAMVQMELEARAKTLREILGMKLIRYPLRRARKRAMANCNGIRQRSTLNV